MKATTEKTVYSGPLGEIWQRDHKAPSYKTFPFGYLAKGGNGMVGSRLANDPLKMH
jgi:hypothetical protein